MQPSVRNGIPSAAPRFYLTERRPLPPWAVLAAFVIAVVAASSLLFALDHGGKIRHPRNGGTSRSSSTRHEEAPEDEQDDPNQVDTIVLGDAADAPTPARRSGHVSAVHPTILIRLPRYGDQVGLIPDAPAGHLLYGWLAAFNQASPAALVAVLPNAASAFTAAAQMELRQRTGGYNLLSAKEVQPGLLVFRLRDQTPDAGEVLGTLQVMPGSSPAAIGSFSLREIPPAGHQADASTAGLTRE